MYFLVHIIEAQWHFRVLRIFIQDDDRLSVNITLLLTVTLSLLNLLWQGVHGLQWINLHWILCKYYPLYTKIGELWNHLCSVGSNITCPWLLMVNFNDIILLRDLSVVVFHFRRNEIGQGVMDEWCLVDLNTIEAIFTWRVNRHFGPCLCSHFAY